MRTKLAIVVAVGLALTGCKKDEAGGGAGAGAAAAEGPWTAKVLAGQELYATITTNMGAVTVKLYSKDAPKTVRNFVGLATGEREWRSPATGEIKKGVPLYAGTIFHRVIEGFMIQGGDPLGTGTGDPGYRFEDELQSGKTFDRVGLLAMANSGPNTNGSQFFITTSTPQWLNGKHTIFGEVVKGYEVVDAIQKVPKGPADRPVQPVKIEKIELSEQAP
ncbi:MAG: peptidylprolyl isomerase [Myxococcota bacterium]|jgi:peptidyl-prolyl cis-trans isomerase A (cyclophilin A)